MGAVSSLGHTYRNLMGVVRSVLHAHGFFVRRNTARGAFSGGPEGNTKKQEEVMSIGNRSSTHVHSQQYEHLLFGSVSEANLPALLHRLCGLCDYSSSGGVPFTDREITFKICKVQA